MNNKPEVTDEEIGKFMNFDKLLGDFKQNQQKRKSTKARNLVLIGVAVFLVTSIVVVTSKMKISASNKVKETASVVAPQKEILSQEKEALPKVIEKATSKQEVVSPNKAKSTREHASKIILKQDYVAAEPVDGYSTLYLYFDKELTYPAMALKDSIHGVETAAFVINASGKAEQIEILNSLGSLFDTEVKRLITNMPAWKPATLNGKPVNSKISVPFTFNINKAK